MDEATLHARLAEALEKINQLPEEQRRPLLALLEETRERHARMKADFARAREALDEWRLMIKYLIFDHEATRRELEALRRRQPPQDPPV